MAELLGDHGLPRVELEDREHLVFDGVEEGLRVGVPADLLHEHLERLIAGLLRRVAQVDQG